MVVTIIINNFQGVIFNTEDIYEPKSMETLLRIDSFEIVISEYGENPVMPILYLDPKNNGHKIRLPLKKKFGHSNLNYSLDKQELLNYPDLESNRYKYIFDKQHLYPEGYVFFTIMVNDFYFNLSVHFPFRLITKDQFKEILEDIQAKGSNFFLNPSNILPEKFKLDDSTDFNKNAGGRKYYLLSILISDIHKYIAEDFILSASYDEYFDEELIAIESSRYQNKFIKFVLMQIIEISKGISNEIIAELTEHKEFKSYKLSRGVKGKEYIEGIEEVIKELETKLTTIKKYIGEMTFYNELTIIKNAEYIPNILQYVGMIVKKNPFLLNILYNYLMLFYTMQYELSSGSSFISYQKIPEVYEHWVFFKICDCITELGFQFIKTDKEFFSFSKKLIPDTTFYYCVTDRNGYKVRLNIIFNRYYEVINPLMGIEYGFANSSYKKKEDIKRISEKIHYKSKRNPDIAIEIFKEGELIPKILFFDATYSENNDFNQENIFIAKMAYTFYFIDKELNNIGIGSWAIIPDKNIPKNSDYGDYIVAENHTNGVLVLNPCDNYSKESLKNLISEKFEEIGIIL